MEAWLACLMDRKDGCMARGGGERYRTEDGKVLIELSLRHARQLFDERDPAPFRERDLDDDAVDYLEAAVEEFPLNQPLKLVIQIVEEPSAHEFQPEALAESIRAHFAYEVQMTRRKLKGLLRQGQIGSLMAMGMLTVCLTSSNLLGTHMGPGPMRDVLKEGLLILGWVVWWQPMESFLFGWWPFYRRIRFLRKLAEMEIEVRYE